MNRDDRLTDIEKIRLLLNQHPRDLLLFEILVHSDLPVKQILQIKVRDLKALQIGDALPVSQRTIGHRSGPIMNHFMQQSFQNLMLQPKTLDSDYLFKSRKGDRPLSITSVSRLVRGWLEEAGLRDYKGLHDLRKAQQHQTAERTQPSEIENQIPSEAVLPKIRIQTRHEAVYTELEKAIISGKIVPGQKLVAEDIARQMGVSRIPVREAMGRLEARGFIMIKPKVGSVVNELSRENLKEILNLRLMLECEAAQKAVSQVKIETLNKLQKAHIIYARARQGDDAEELLRSNREFHLLVYHDAKSPLLLELINQLWGRVSPYYHMMFRQSLTQNPTIGVNYHEHILDAMQKRDAQQVRHWLKVDLINSTEFVLKLFDLHNQQSAGLRIPSDAEHQFRSIPNSHSD